MKKTILKATVAALFVALTTAAAGEAAAQNVKFAFVDRMRALNETHEGKKAMKKLEGMKNKLQKTIQAKEASIMKMKETLEKQQNVLTKEALQKKAEEYYKALNELQQSYMQFQRDLAGKEAELTKDILVKMESIIADIGKAEGYTMIFDRSTGAVVWAPSHLDLTDKLIQKYNAKYKGKKK